MDESMTRRHKRRVKVNWGRLLAVLGITLLALTLMVGTAAYVYLRGFSSGNPGSLKDAADTIQKERVNILVLGTDVGTVGNTSTSNRTRSDTIMVANVNTKTGAVNIINIPRDSRVEIPGRSGLDKITHAHAYGGTELSKATVENFLGVKIDYYVEINYEGFVKVIDALGGVPIDVEKRMYYRDPTQDLVIDLQPGQQTLDGANSLGYVRFRHDALGDIGRIQRQQKFMQALSKKMRSPSTLTKAPKIARILPEYINTDMTPKEIISFASLMISHAKEGRVVSQMVPGTDAMIDNLSYWVPDMLATRRLVEEMTSDNASPGAPNLKIQVLNGSGGEGVAQKVKDELETRGYTVVKTGNADNFDYETSQVVLTNNNDSYSKSAKKIADLLDNAEVVRADEPVEGVDITVIIGKNYQ